MKNRIIVDLSVFNTILRELKAIRKQLAGKEAAKPLPKRELRDAIYTDEVLRILKITPATLNAYEKKGLLQFHREGRKKVYSENEVREFKTSKGRKKRLTNSVISQRFKK